MYTTTFYSFKGGVGRSMALVNVGVELVKKGKRVLLVDFDLEAPGLDTFDLLRPSQPVQGLVDFLFEYIATDQVPDVRKYLYAAPFIGVSDQQLWIMPAGNKDESYPSKLGSIDWQSLYEQRDGFLLFEDLKAQWKDAIHPDYVFIDSRTGYTDVAGICTRQLPDAAVVLFFPNEQNLLGLKDVVAGIRAEESGPRKKKIQLHFVTSNVPDLDDENEILANRLARFRKALHYKQPAAVIHHYDSLALLNQVVFTDERPRSRLAREYRELCRAIVSRNFADREGALQFLKELRADSVQGTGLSELDAIKGHHATDGSVLAEVGKAYMQLGRFDDALSLLGAAHELGFRLPWVLINLAQLRSMTGDRQGETNALLEVLASPAARLSEVSTSVNRLLFLDFSRLKNLGHSEAYSALPISQKVEVIWDLFTKSELLPTAESMLRELLSQKPDDSGRAEQSDIENPLVLTLIGQGKFKEAFEMFPSQAIPSMLSAQDAFNYAMASWGMTGTPPVTYFSRVVEVDREERLERTANQIQCAALSYWAIGEIPEAIRRIEEARRRSKRDRVQSFSAWRYRMLGPQQFRFDLDEMETMMVSGIVRPPVLRNNGNAEQ